MPINEIHWRSSECLVNKVLYRSSKSKIQQCLLYIEEKKISWRQNGFDNPFTKNGSFTMRKIEKRAKKPLLLCWVDVLIPAGWPMKSDPSGGCGPDGPPTTCFPNFSLQNIREHQRNVLVSIHNHFTILADLIVAPVQI